MSVKFKPTQIAMPLSANYGRWYAKMVPTATVTSRQLAEEVAHSSTVTQADMLAVLWSLSDAIRRRQHERATAASTAICAHRVLLHCYIVTCYIKVVSQCSLYSVIAEGISRIRIQ